MRKYPIDKQPIVYFLIRGSLWHPRHPLRLGSRLAEGQFWPCRCPTSVETGCVPYRVNGYFVFF